MSYHHLTTFERGRIQELLSLGYSHRAIAQKLNRHRSCIDREIRRNAVSVDYVGETAQTAYDTRRQRSKPKGKYTDDLITIITEKLEATWSPEQISNTVTLGIGGFKTIYNWIYAGIIPTISVKNLRQKGKRRKAEKCGRFSMETPISERPSEVKTRDSFGHWKFDSMVLFAVKARDALLPLSSEKPVIYGT